jgi:hypothetical protein
MLKQRVFQSTNYVPLILKILSKTPYSCYSLLCKHNRQLFDSSIMFLSIHCRSSFIGLPQEGVGDSSLLGLITGSTKRFIGKEIKRNEGSFLKN